MADQPFDTVLEPEVEQLVKDVEKLGVTVVDREAKKAWVREILKKGFSLKLIREKLKEYNYDFDTADRYFKEMSVAKEKATEATKGVEKLKEEKAADEKKKKLTSRLGLILTAFILGGVGFFTWRMMKKTTEGISDINLMAGPAGGLLTNFNKGAFIVGVAGIGVGVLLSVLVAAEHFIKMSKAKKEKPKEGGKSAEQVKQEMEQQFTDAEKISGQKMVPPKLVASGNVTQQKNVPPKTAQVSQQKPVSPKLIP